jgi:hypothetical protein
MVLPKLRDVLPKSREVLPKLGEVLPKSRTILPKSRDIQPKSRDIQPKSGTILPKSRDIQPKSGTILPKSQDILPKSGTVLPKLREVLPKLRDVLPKWGCKDLCVSGLRGFRTQAPPPRLGDLGRLGFQPLSDREMETGTRSQKFEALPLSTSRWPLALSLSPAGAGARGPNWSWPA